MLESFTIATFQPHVGERFTVGTHDLVLRLTSIEDWSRRAGSHSAEYARAPFSLLFHALDGKHVPQGTYALKHDRIGEFGLFIVPLGPDSEGMRYQAVFT